MGSCEPHVPKSIYLRVFYDDICDADPAGPMISDCFTSGLQEIFKNPYWIDKNLSISTITNQIQIVLVKTELNGPAVKNEIIIAKPISSISIPLQPS